MKQSDNNNQISNQFPAPVTGVSGDLVNNATAGLLSLTKLAVINRFRQSIAIVIDEPINLSLGSSVNKYLF